MIWKRRRAPTEDAGVNTLLTASTIHFGPARRIGRRAQTIPAGIVIPVLWFGMDWQGAADKDALAEERCRSSAAEKPAKKTK